MATRTISALGGNWSATTAWDEAQVPVAADNVVATVLSASLVVTAASVCRSADFTNYTGTLSGSGDLTIGDAAGGSLKFVAGMTITYTGAVTFASTTTGNAITNAGQSLASTLTFNGVGGVWSLADALVTTGAITLTNGSLSDGGQNVTAPSFAGSNANVRTLTLGAGAKWLLNGTGTVWNMATTTNLTLTAVPASNIIELSDATAASKTFAGGGLSYATLQIDSGGAGLVIITGANTFNQLAIAAPKSVQFPVSVTQTLTRAPEWRGDSTHAITITSSSAGTAATLSSAENSGCDWLSLKDSTATGGGVFDAGANSTNVSGNTGWVFSAAPTKSNIFISLGFNLGFT